MKYLVVVAFIAIVASLASALFFMMRKGQNDQDDRAKGRHMARALALRVGLSMVSTVDTTDTSGPVLTTVARTKPVMATRVYAAELDDVSARVADLIAANAGGQG